MSHRPLIADTGTTRTETRVLKGILLGALAALLLVFGARMFVLGEKSEDANPPQQRTEAPVASELPGKTQ
jgi:hypothetical protein